MTRSVDIPTGLKFEPWSDERRRVHLRETLAAAPDPENIWVFAYGSLIWDPRFTPAETRHATLSGHRRSYCFWVTMARGTPERPGLGLGLLPGTGTVAGIAMRIPQDRYFDAVMEALWRREMLGGVYSARWLPLSTDTGDVQAIVYVANETHPSFAGELPVDDQVRIMARAEGSNGKNYEYLGKLVETLDRNGIEDSGQRALYDRIVEYLHKGN